MGIVILSKKLRSIDKNTEYVAMVLNNKIVAMAGAYKIDERSYHLVDSVVIDQFNESGYIEELIDYLNNYLRDWAFAEIVKPKTLYKTSK